MMGVLIETEQTTTWFPPPKKKWIRHYLLSEVPKDYKTYAALQNNPSSSSNNNVTVPLSSSSSCSSSSSSSSSAASTTSVTSTTTTPPQQPQLFIENHIIKNPQQKKPVVVNGLSKRLQSTPPPPPQIVPLQLSTLAAAAAATTTITTATAVVTSTTSINNHSSNNAVTHQIPNIPPPAPTSCIYGSLQPHDGSYLAARLTAPQNNETTKININNSALAAAFTLNSNAIDNDLKRRIGQGTREVHNKLEKNRRAHLKECFEALRRQLPSSHDDKKPSNLSVLHSAIRYIQTLKRKERDYEHEMERLAREKIACQQRLSALKKELSAQWDHLDFATILPEAPPPSASGLATRSLARSYDSDDDFEFEELDDDFRRPIGHISPQHSQNSASTSTASERGQTSDIEDLTMSSRPGSSRDLYSSPPPLPPTFTTLRTQENNNTTSTIRSTISTITIKNDIGHMRNDIEEVKLEDEKKDHKIPIHINHHGPGTIVRPTIQLLTQPIQMLTAKSTEHKSIIERNIHAQSIGDPSKNNRTATAKLLPHQLLNGTVISHAPAAIHRPLSTVGGNTSGATVLTAVHGTPTVLNTHQLPSGITHVVSASGTTTQLSTLGPLVATPMTMVTPGNPHGSGVHILTKPFQVVPGQLLKTHQVLPQFITGPPHLVKPSVVMVSSQGVLQQQREPIPIATTVTGTITTTTTAAP